MLAAYGSHVKHMHIAWRSVGIGDRHTMIERERWVVWTKKVVDQES